jgi:hypothetical protein
VNRDPEAQFGSDIPNAPGPFHSDVLKNVERGHGANSTSRDCKIFGHLGAVAIGTDRGAKTRRSEAAIVGGRSPHKCDHACIPSVRTVHPRAACRTNDLAWAMHKTFARDVPRPEWSAPDGFRVAE